MRPPELFQGMATQTKNIDTAARSKLAHELTMDQYIKRYAQQIKPLSYSAWLDEQQDFDGDGRVTAAERRAFYKRYPDDKTINAAYAEYLDTVVKTNAYYQREAEKIWESANAFHKAGENAVYENAFASGDMRTMAQEKQANATAANWSGFALNNSQLLIYAAIAVALILMLKK